MSPSSARPWRPRAVVAVPALMIVAVASYTAVAARPSTVTPA